MHDPASGFPDAGSCFFMDTEPGNESCDKRDQRS